MASRATWMQDNFSTLKDRTLLQLCLPGSHDAGMYSLQGCTSAADPANTQTQTQTFLQQLNLGVRWFDVRVGVYNDLYYTCHQSTVPDIGIQGCYGASVSDLLNDIQTFLGLDNQKELIVLKFSHFTSDVTDDGIGTFCEWVSATLEDDMFFDRSTITPAPASLAEITLGQFLSNGTEGKVLALVDGLSAAAQSATPKFYAYASYNPTNSVTGTVSGAVAITPQSNDVLVLGFDGGQPLTFYLNPVDTTIADVAGDLNNQFFTSGTPGGASIDAASGYLVITGTGGSGDIPTPQVQIYEGSANTTVGLSASLPSPCDLVVYDNYADMVDAGHMATDQEAKLLSVTNRNCYPSNLFLLSYTVTLDATDAALDSNVVTGGGIATGVTLAVVFPGIGTVVGALIIGFAVAGRAEAPTILTITSKAKATLATFISSTMILNGLTPNVLPNIILVDNCDGRETDAAILVNQNYGVAPSDIPTGSNNKNYIPQGGDGGLINLYANTDPVLIPTGATLTGFQFIQLANQALCQLTVQLADGSSQIIEGVPSGNYVHWNSTRGMSEIYACLNPCLVPDGSTLLGIGFQQQANQLCLAAYVENPNGDATWALPGVDDNYYPQGGQGGLTHTYFDTNPVAIPTTQSIMGLALWVNGNQLVPAVMHS